LTSPQSLVSVIIPCWNAATFVGRAIESALSQSYSPVEVIVIDDGSTDGSLDVIRGFGPRVRYEVAPHAGAAAARNRGQKLARGSYWLFLDADDILLPDAADMLLDAVMTAGADCAYGNVRLVDESLSPMAVRTHEPRKDSTLKAFLRAVPITSGVLCSRHTTTAWDETKVVCNEFHYFMMRAIAGDTFVHVPEFTALIRNHGAPHRVSNGTRAKFMSTLGQCWEEIEEQLRAKKLVDCEIDAMLSDKYLGLSLGCRQIGLRELSLRFDAKIDRKLLRRLPDFRWFSSRGAYLLGGMHAAAFANDCRGSLRLISTNSKHPG
jgi:glycosyltransferase involved in cell wall biosynthesis